MRVLMLGKGWFPTELGGLNRYFRELLQVLPNSEGVVIGPGSDAPCDVLVVSSSSASLPVRLYKFTAAALRARARCDVVDAHFALYAWLPLRLGLTRGRPVVVHFQGPWAGESRAAGQGGLRTQVKRRIERWVYQRADVLITLTHAFKRVLVDAYGIDPSRVHVVAPGVDTSWFSPGDRVRARERFELMENDFVVACARRLTPRMGIEVLVEAWCDVIATTADAYLLIAGAGPMAGPLQELIQSRGLGEHVRLLGRISDADLIELYRAADVNVLPSVAHEGFGLTVLEAAACGTPSIVTNVGGLPEAVGGLGEDLVVEARDAAALSSRLNGAGGGTLPTREATRRWAETRNWESVGQAHQRLYAEFEVSGRGTSNSARG